MKQFRLWFGEPGDRPESFWRPEIGHLVHVGEVGDLTRDQLVDTAEFIERSGR